MFQWLANLSKFISPAEAQRAHISLLEAEKRQLLSLIENQARTINELRSENENLKTKLGGLNHESEKSDAPLDATREKILSFLAKNGGSTKNQIADVLIVSSELAMFHLNELLFVDFVHRPAPYAPSETWSIAQDGRAYLVRHGLL